jgi:hypothetical protein
MHLNIRMQIEVINVLKVIFGFAITLFCFGLNVFMFLLLFSSKCNFLGLFVLGFLVVVFFNFDLDHMFLCNQPCAFFGL